MLNIHTQMTSLSLCMLVSLALPGISGFKTVYLKNMLSEQSYFPSALHVVDDNLILN